MAFADATPLTPLKLTALAATTLPSLSAVDGTDGNTFPVSVGTLLRVINGSGGSITVTVHTNYERAGLALPDKTFTVSASGDVIFAFGDPIDTFWYDRATRMAWVEFSSGTSVTAAVYQP